MAKRSYGQVSLSISIDVLSIQNLAALVSRTTLTSDSETGLETNTHFGQLLLYPSHYKEAEDGEHLLRPHTVVM